MKHLDRKEQHRRMFRTGEHLPVRTAYCTDRRTARRRRWMRPPLQCIDHPHYDDGSGLARTASIMLVPTS